MGVAGVQKALAIHKDAHARAAAIAVDDFLEGAPGVFARPAVTVGVFLQVALHGKGIPEGGIGRIIGCAVGMAAEDIGDQAVPHAVWHLRKHVQAKLFAPAIKGQARQGDKGVASPGVKPVIARNDLGLPAGGGDAEILADFLQMADKPVNLFMLFCPGRGNRIPEFGDFLARAGQGFRADGHIDAAAVFDIRKRNIYYAGLEKVFRVVKAAVSFPEILDSVVPAGVWLVGMGGTDLEKHFGHAGIGLDAETAGRGLRPVLDCVIGAG